MRIILGMLNRLGRDRKGATAVEYGLIVSLVVIAIIASLQALAGETTSMWGNVHDKVISAS